VNSREFQDRLGRRARKAGVAIGPDVSERLEAYYRLLATWNKKINLTGLQLLELAPEAVDRLLIEPLIAAKHITSARRAIDIGSGGGSPAIPLAISVPGLSVLMVESKTRKSVFLREVIRTVGLEGADVLTARFEELLTDPKLHESHDLLTTRAVRIEARALMGLQAFVRPGGELFLFRSAAMSGGATVTPPLYWKASYPLLEAPASSLVILEKRSVGPPARPFHVKQP